MVNTSWINQMMKTAFTDSTSSFYLGLSSSKPTASGGGYTEPTGGSYARVNVGAFSSPSSGTVRNVNTLVFPTSTAAWFPSDRKAAYWCIFAGQTSGAQLVASGALDTPRTIDAGAVVTIPANAISITLANDDA